MIIAETTDILKDIYGGELDRLGIERIAIGLFFTGVKLTNGFGGLSYTPLSEVSEATCCPTMASKRPPVSTLKEGSVRDALDCAREIAMLRTVKVAVLNALSNPLIQNGKYKSVLDKDPLDLIDLKKVKRLTMVGAFTPFLKAFKSIDGLDFRVVERKRTTFREDELRFYVPAEKAAEALSGADTVIITGSSIANGSIDELLGYIDAATTVAVVGPTASFVPEAFFRRKVTMENGVVVTDADEALDTISEGGSGYHLFNVSARKINILRG